MHLNMTAQKIGQFMNGRKGRKFSFSHKRREKWVGRYNKYSENEPVRSTGLRASVYLQTMRSNKELL